MAKLIRENIEDINVLTEAVEGSDKKKYYVEGIFIQGNSPNRNRRIYPMAVLEKEVGRYVKESINENRALGELGHPDGPTINLDRVSHQIMKLTREGNDYIGKAKILDTPNGRIVESFLKEKIKIGMSTRAMGSLVEKNGIMEVQDDLRLATAGDFVADPSAHKAFVNGIMENAEWVYDLATDSWKAIDLLEQTRKTGKILNEEEIFKVFKKFISNIVK
jgi:hypothetical protein